METAIGRESGLAGDSDSRISFMVSEDDYVRFQEYHIAHSPTLVRRHRNARLLFPSVVAAVSIFEAFRRQFDPLVLWADAAVTLLICTLWWVYYPAYIRRCIRRCITKMLREGKNAGLAGENEYQAGPKGLTWKSSAGEGKSPWSAFERIASTPDHLFLYTSAVSALIVPRRSVLSGDWDAFRRAVESFAPSVSA